VEVERRANPDQYRIWEKVDIFVHPQHLLGAAQTHPNDIGLGRHYLGHSDGFLVIRERSEWRRIEASDDQAIVKSTQPCGQLLGDALRATIKVMAPSLCN
jgi:hypothetical protein